MKYENIIIPKDTNPEDYPPPVRQAEIYKLLIEVGDRSLLSVTQLAQRYKKDPSLISKDLNRIEEEIRADIKKTHKQRFVTRWETLYRKAVKKGDLKLANDIQKSFTVYMQDSGETPKAIEKSELKVKWMDANEQAKD